MALSGLGNQALELVGAENSVSILQRLADKRIDGTQEILCGHVRTSLAAEKGSGIGLTFMAAWMEGVYKADSNDLVRENDASGVMPPAERVRCYGDG
jgi:hypothetical protein